MYNQGDIVLVPFPFTNQINSVTRPALIISGNNFNKTSDDILLVQITKVDHADGNSVPLTDGDVTKPLKYVSEVRCHKILVAEQNLILRQISKVNQNIIDQVIVKIQGILNN